MVTLISLIAMDISIWLLTTIKNENPLLLLYFNWTCDHPLPYVAAVFASGQKGSLEKKSSTHSSILAWGMPWSEEPGGPQSTGSQRVGHDWVTHARQYSCLGNPMESRAWWAIVHGVTRVRHDLATKQQLLLTLPTPLSLLLNIIVTITLNIPTMTSLLLQISLLLIIKNITKQNMSLRYHMFIFMYLGKIVVFFSYFVLSFNRTFICI